MRSSRHLLVVVVLGLVVTACSDTGSTTTSPASTITATTVATTAATAPPRPTTEAPPTTAGPVTTNTLAVADGSLVGRPLIDPLACAFGDPPPADEVEITFVRDGYLLAADRDTWQLRCVAPFENQERMMWGPAGDRLLLDTTRVTADGAFAGVVGSEALFTRPTGRNLIWVEDGRLWKAATDGSSLREISFLGEHVAVAYHPAGVEIATVGIDDEGRYGVWISRNDGTEAQRVVTADEATITEVAFSESSGFFLSFIAEHEDGTSHLHEIALVDAQGLAVRNEFDASIALETNRSLSGLVANPWTDEIAVTEGTCADPDGPRARLPWGAEIPSSLPEMPTEVIAWLPGSELLLGAYPTGCDGIRELWVVGTGEGVPTFAMPDLFARQVGTTAVRAALPDPPLPLGEIDLDDFA